MHFSSLRQFFVACAFFLFSTSIFGALAIPVTSQEPAALLERAPAPDPYEDKAGIEAAYVAGDKPSVFFSNIGATNQQERDAPDTFAGSIGGRTFKSAFNAGFTDRRGGPGGRTFYRAFAQRFSEVFAEQATGTAYVLMRDDPNGPHPNSVWTLYERPALENGNKVDKIVKVNPSDFSQTTTLWTRSGSKVKAKKDVPDKRDYVLDWDAPADGPYWLAPGE